MLVLEVLRLYEQLSYSLREIENTSICSKTTAGKIINRCKELNLNYDVAKTLTEKKLKSLIFPETPGRQTKKLPDYSVIHQKLNTSKKNQQYLWEDAVQRGETDLSYSRFCFHYRNWKNEQGYGVYTPIDRKPGEKLYVDWAGDTLKCVFDSQKGKLLKTYFFVSTLGVSGYPYCEATTNMDQFSFNNAHVNALKWYGALPKIIVPDNCQTAVTRASMWDPKLNRAYLELAQHYKVAIHPARVRKPKDKASVETTVKWLETWLLEFLKDTGPFYSLNELNEVIKRRLKELVNRNYTESTRKNETRLSLYQKVDLPAMRALAKSHMEIYDFKRGTVPDYYHAMYDSFYYSIPYYLFKKPYTLHAFQNRIQIFVGNEQVALHQRKYSGKRYVTKTEHMPEKDKYYLSLGQKDGNYYRRWASNYSQECRDVIESILSSFDYEPQGYKSCLGILMLAKKYSIQTLNAACSKALELNSPSYTTVSRLLKTNAQFIQTSVCANETVPEPEDLRTKQWKSLKIGGLK